LWPPPATTTSYLIGVTAGRYRGGR
jgi:hypothetical protein